MKNNKKTRILVEIAIFSVLCVILDTFSFRAWGQGGSISLQMLPILIISFRRGLKVGLITGLVFGILQLILGAYIINPFQAFLDYPLAFALVGFGGIFSKNIYKSYIRGKKISLILFIVLGSFLGSLLRLIVHIISAMIYFGAGAGPHQTVLIYSIIYNSSYVIPSFIITTIVLIIIMSSFKGLFFKNV
ncbi:energy-coupled thiamine transporter ThiT [Lactococcus lactis]|uniref:energy-coupled thiamine transporter ThiT n=1 Tax=Lactococcus lactis TaxID=1358 RepID=UPI00056ED2EA|nr:energy-coupled thiamine transporter ThiT [Lactococcus lactis]